MTFSSHKHPSDAKLADSIGRNTFFGIVCRFAQAGTRLITVPFVIAHLGLDGYGIWAILMTIATYMRFGSVGIKSAFQKYVAESTGNGDYDRTNRLLSTGCVGILTLSIAALLPVALFSTELARLTGVPMGFLHSSAQAISALAVIMVLSNFGAVYEAILMGAHRIDLVTKLSTVFTVAEAGAILLLLHLQYGLVAMALVMAASEVLFLSCCYLCTRVLLPQFRVALQLVTRDTVVELIRFAGSYQLLSILQVLYFSIIPVTVLKTFGAELSGLYSLVFRLVNSSLLLSNALLLPILSGGAMVYASGSTDQMQKLILKSFKVTLALCLFPLGALVILGPTLIYAWTGQTHALLRSTIWFVAIAGFCQALSVLGLVLYRASGRTLHDNMRQAVQLVALLCIAGLAHWLTFMGVMIGLAMAEIIGMIFMLSAISTTFRQLKLRALLSDTIRLTAATILVLAAAILAIHIPVGISANVRLRAISDLAKAIAACGITAWPVLLITKCITEAELKAILRLIVPAKLASQAAYVGGTD